MANAAITKLVSQGGHVRTPTTIQSLPECIGQ